MRELEFRDGKRLVPEHLADMMSGLKTHTMTYEEAVAKANWQLVSDHANRVADEVVQGHFRNRSGR
jgi:hypothetical protein